jgi:hypothetical protein
MPVRLTRALSTAFLFVSLALLPSADCLNGQASPHVSLVFRNSDPSVAYVGSATCTVPGCHQDIGPTYAQSPHGQSMAPANSAGELARAPQPITVFNRKNGRYYTVYQEGGNLYQSAYELDKAGHRLNATVHKIDYVAGGQRTGYSYLFRIGAWIFQAPLSYYAPSKTWELSPGYVADDPGFTRGMTTGCLVCHNGQPDPVARRDGMYKEPPFRFGELGISCEACHGPGALHVKEMQNQKGCVLGPGEVDTSIVNPARLSPRLADDICRECHQAGDAVVLMPGKADLDFLPGTPLADTMAIVKRPIKAEQREEANRLERNPPVRGSLEQPLWWKNSTLELSKCYQASNGQLTCSTCHSTHHAPRPEDEKAAYRAACLSCHKQSSCTLKRGDSKRLAVGDYCIACHMERRPVAGIAHSNDTKHRIVRFSGQPLPEVAFEQPHPGLPGLLWINRPTDEAVLPGSAQLQAYWTVARKDPSLWPLWFRKLDELSRSSPNDPAVLNSLGAVALAENKDYVKAADYFSRALRQGSEEPTTFLNLAAALQGLGRAQEAKAILERGVEAYPYNGALVVRLGLQCATLGEGWKAHDLVARYARSFPEDESSREALRIIDARGNDASPSGRSAPVAPPR